MQGAYAHGSTYQLDQGTEEVKGMKTLNEIKRILAEKRLPKRLAPIRL